MKITKLYINSSLDFKLWNWKRIDEYPTSDGREAEEVIGKYIIAEGCETIFGNVAAYATTFHYSKVLNYDAVIYVGKTYVGDKIDNLYPKTFKANHELHWFDKIFPATFNADIFNAICHCMEIPFIFISSDNQISAEVAESYSENSYYILTSPHELQHTLRKLGISSKSKILLLQLDNDFDDDEEDTASDVLNAISVVENTLSNWK